MNMSINKDDCLDCVYLKPVFDKRWITLGWVCQATGKHKCSVLAELELLDEDCPNFKYQE